MHVLLFFFFLSPFLCYSLSNCREVYGPSTLKNETQTQLLLLFILIFSLKKEKYQMYSENSLYWEVFSPGFSFDAVPVRIQEKFVFVIGELFRAWAISVTQYLSSRV